MKKIITVLLSLLFTVNAKATDISQYQVSITNATTHHVFTPALIVTHRSSTSLFTTGQPASDGLILQAETGDPSLLLAETQARHGTYDTLIGSFIAYGQQASYIISAAKKSHLSLTAMLATSNDAFVALNNVALPDKSVTYYAHVYDAGSETNNEDCAFIPGPPCAEASGNARSTDNEGFISLHNGIHGIASLNAHELDWRGPVAIVTIKRLKH
ncbi:MAG: spondin domain-containing protein [Gammaproteobacteria bacterium]|nr:spondin domain-containing protein [Gammaproteobacteria bacterium]